MANKYDLMIIGGGPAGLTAAIYGGRAKLKTLIINKGTIGGLVDTTRELANYPGYINISGPDLMQDFKEHAESFGVEIIKDEVTAVNLAEEEKQIRTKKNKEFIAKAVVIASGSEPRLLNIPGEKEMRGNGVAYCATCDAEYFEDEDVVIIGSGDQAIEEGIHITKFAKKVTVIVLHDEGILDCNKVSAEKAFNNKKMHFIWNSTIEEVLGEKNPLGEKTVTGVKLKNLKTGESSKLDCQGVFFFVGMIPMTGFIKDSGVIMDHKGYIPVNERMETNIEGVYAAGDNRVKYLRQVATSVGDGATAAVAAERYIEELNDFKENVMGSKVPVIVYFFDPTVEQSLEFSTLLEKVLAENELAYKLFKIDLSLKKTLAKKYAIKIAPSAVILKDGKVIKRLDCSINPERVLEQLKTT